MHLLEGGRAVTDPIDVGTSPIDHMRAMNYLMPTTTTEAALAALEVQERLRATASPGLVLDTLIALPHISSAGLRKIADEAQRIIDGRIEDGVFE